MKLNRPRQVALVSDDGRWQQIVYCMVRSCHVCLFRFRCYTEGGTLMITLNELKQASSCISDDRLLTLIFRWKQRRTSEAEVNDATFREITKERFFLTELDRTWLSYVNDAWVNV